MRQGPGQIDCKRRSERPYRCARCGVAIWFSRRGACRLRRRLGLTILLITAQQNGLITVTGGKLTTFRVMALDVLKAIPADLLALPPITETAPVLLTSHRDLPDHLSSANRQRLAGRYGDEAADLVSAAKE